MTYITAWTTHTDDLKDLQIQRAEMQKAENTLQEKSSNVSIHEDALFDEVTSLQELLKGESLRHSVHLLLRQ